MVRSGLKLTVLSLQVPTIPRVSVLHVEKLQEREYKSGPVVRLLQKVIHLVLVYGVYQDGVGGEVEDSLSERFEMGQDGVRLAVFIGVTVAV